MRIPGHDPLRFWETSIPGDKRMPKGGPPGASPEHRSDAGDRIELSARAKEGSALRYDPVASSDARIERVAAVAQRVADGAYSATSEEIANGLIRAAIFDRLL